MKDLILDLDNTIYPVSSIGEKLFAPVFKLLKLPEYQLSAPTIEKAKQQIMRVPFQKVAQELNFPARLTQSAVELLRNLSYNERIDYFSEYPLIRELDSLKFLITTGFRTLQESKITALSIRQDFTEIFVIDPDTSEMSKKNAMELIMEKYKLLPSDLLVIGDDPESEIKAATELGIESFLLDSENLHPYSNATYKGKTLADVLQYLD
jgi:putative hydrolase of the HAD superfamily